MTRWICDFCGQAGQTPPGMTADEVLCPDCGEPVTPASTDR